MNFAVYYEAAKRKVLWCRDQVTQSRKAMYRENSVFFFLDKKKSIFCIIQYIIEFIFVVHIYMDGTPIETAVEIIFVLHYCHCTALYLFDQ